MRKFLEDSKDIIDSLAEASKARRQLDKESKEFMRLSKQTVKGDFFDVEKEIRALYNLAKNGTDYNRKRMQDLIKKLQKIDKSAALYSDRKSVPKNYQ
jgi:uncharacterized tellurite resistance protein B-like protein